MQGIGWPTATAPRIPPRVRLPWYPPSCAQYAWLAHHPGLFAAWGALAAPAEFLQWAVASLSHRDIELVNMRASWNSGGYYHWAYHLIWSRVRGKGADFRAAIKAGPDAPYWSDREATLLRAVDELHDDLAIAPATLDKLRGYFDERELIEICFITGHYELLAMTFESIGLPFDGWRPERPSPRDPLPRRRRQPTGLVTKWCDPADGSTGSWFPVAPEATAILAAHPMLSRLLRFFARDSSRFARLDPHDRHLAVQRTLVGAGASNDLSTRDALLLRAVDELDTEYFIRDETWLDLNAVLDAAQLIELCFLVGHYRTFAMMLNSLGDQT